MNRTITGFLEKVQEEGRTLASEDPSQEVKGEGRGRDSRNLRQPKREDESDTRRGPSWVTSGSLRVRPWAWGRTP